MNDKTTAERVTEIKKRSDDPDSLKHDALMVEELSEAGFEAFIDFLRVHNLIREDRAELLAIVGVLQKQLSRNRWNIEVDGDNLLVCDGEHDKGEGCKYQTYTPTERAEQAESMIAEIGGLADERRRDAVDMLHQGHGFAADRVADFSEKIQSIIRGKDDG